MSNYNKVLLMGRLTKDPELRYTPQGVPVTDIGLAINREYSVQGQGQGPSGERRKETTFVDVTVWRRRAEVICQYLKKGDPIFIEGRLTLDTWETQEGRRSKLKVIADNFNFIGSPRGGGGARGDYGGGGAAPPPPAPSQGGGYTDYEYQGSPFPQPPADQGSAPPESEPYPEGRRTDESEGGEPLSDSDIPF